MNRTQQIANYGETAVRKLWPVAESAEDLSDNDSSLVTLIEYAGRKIMLCSDIGKAAQLELIRLYEGLDVDVLVSPHHGSVTTALTGFEGVFKPEYVITSCAWYQYDRIIKSDYEDELYERFFTNRDGRVNVEITSDGQIRVSGYR